MSSTSQVIRYSALLSGVAYGWYHRRSLRAAHVAHKTEHQEQHREHLIAEAKEAWKKKQEASKVTDARMSLFAISHFPLLTARSCYRPRGPAVRPREARRALGKGNITPFITMSSPFVLAIDRQCSPTIFILQGMHSSQ